MKSIFVLGSLNTDLAIKADVLPREGETVNGKDFKVGAGGKGLNQAIAASKLGGHVKFLGAIGNDSFGLMMKNALKENNVNTENIHEFDGISSGIAVILLNNSNNRIVLDLGANLKISKQDVGLFLSDAKPGDIFVTQLENNLDAIGYGLKIAKEKSMVTVLNPAPANLDIKVFIKYVDYLIPNETEYDILKDIILENQKLIITKGKDGYEYSSPNNKFSGMAPRVNVVDTTGAGDCFVGAFVYALSNDENVSKETLDFVTKIASISTTRFGSSVSSPTLEEVKKFTF